VHITVNPGANMPPSVSITAPTNGASFPAPANITITADASDDGSVTKVEFFNGGALLGTDMTGPYSFAWNSVPGGNYTLTAKATDNLGATTTSAPVAITVTTTGVPAPWVDQDIGATGLAGSATYGSGTFTIKASGADISGANDAFHYVYQAISGDTTIVARVATLLNTHAWAKSGVMIRETLAPNSKNAMMAITTGNGFTFQRRVTTGGSTSATSGGAGTAPKWLKLVRAGDTLTGFQSADGVNWTQIGSATVSMTADVYVGLAVTSHANSARTTSTVNNVSVTQP
jgi:regulation of enolase protein 1 (concanavalin A-like superfamily)